MAREREGRSSRTSYLRSSQSTSVGRAHLTSSLLPGSVSSAGAGSAEIDGSRSTAASDHAPCSAPAARSPRREPPPRSLAPAPSITATRRTRSMSSPPVSAEMSSMVRVVAPGSETCRRGPHRGEAGSGGGRGQRGREPRIRHRERSHLDLPPISAPSGDLNDHAREPRRTLHRHRRAARGPAPLDDRSAERGQRRVRRGSRQSRHERQRDRHRRVAPARLHLDCAGAGRAGGGVRCVPGGRHPGRSSRRGRQAAVSSAGAASP